MVLRKNAERVKGGRWREPRRRRLFLAASRGKRPQPCLLPPPRRSPDTPHTHGRMSSWNPWAAPAPQRKEDTLFGDAYTSLASRVAALPAPTLAASAFAAGVLATLGVSFAYKRNFKRITNVEWITPDIYARKQWIKGRVVRFVTMPAWKRQTLTVHTSVGDADNFRVYHTPGIGWRWPLKFRTVPSSPKGVQSTGSLPMHESNSSRSEG